MSMCDEACLIWDPSDGVHDRAVPVPVYSPLSREHPNGRWGASGICQACVRRVGGFRLFLKLVDEVLLAPEFLVSGAVERVIKLQGARHE